MAWRASPAGSRTRGGHGAAAAAARARREGAGAAGDACGGGAGRAGRARARRDQRRGAGGGAGAAAAGGIARGGGAGAGRVGGGCAGAGCGDSRPRTMRRRWRAEGESAMAKMVFIERDGTRREVEAPVGLSVLEIAHKHGVDIEGACEGSLACSTCHVIVDPEWYEMLKEASEDEEDMLDLAFGLTQTSRLGCQIIMTEELDGLTVRLPQATRNMMNG